MELLQTLRKIRACEGDAAAQLLLEAYAAQQAAAEREKLNMLRAFVADDAIACTYQTLGQYRIALLRALRA